MRRNILVLLSLMPISSISFAALYSAELGLGHQSDSRKYDYEAELMRRLIEGSLSEKYYIFLEDNGISSIEELLGPDFRSHREELKEEFVKDMYTFDMANNSISGTKSEWPPWQP